MRACTHFPSPGSLLLRSFSTFSDTITSTTWNCCCCTRSRGALEASSSHPLYYVVAGRPNPKKVKDQKETLLRFRSLLLRYKPFSPCKRDDTISQVRRDGSTEQKGNGLGLTEPSILSFFDSYHTFITSELSPTSAYMSCFSSEDSGCD